MGRKQIAFGLGVILLTLLLMVGADLGAFEKFTQFFDSTKPESLIQAQRSMDERRRELFKSKPLNFLYEHAEKLKAEKYCSKPDIKAEVQDAAYLRLKKELYVIVIDKYCPQTIRWSPNEGRYVENRKALPKQLSRLTEIYLMKQVESWAHCPEFEMPKHPARGRFKTAQKSYAKHMLSTTDTWFRELAEHQLVSEGIPKSDLQRLPKASGKDLDTECDRILKNIIEQERYR